MMAICAMLKFFECDIKSIVIQNINDLNTFLINDQFTNDCSLLAIAELDGHDLLEAHKYGDRLGFQDKLKLKILRQDQVTFRA